MRRRTSGSASRRTGALAQVAAVLFVILGCSGDARRGDSTADSAFADPTPADSARSSAARDSARPAPSDTAARDTGNVFTPGPPLIVAADSAAGDSLYHNSRGKCLTCHGPRGAGIASLGPSLRDSVWVDTDGSVGGIASIIRDGVAAPKAGTARMPAFGRQLDSLAMRRIAIYVHSLSHPGSVARDSAEALRGL